MKLNKLWKTASQGAQTSANTAPKRAPARTGAQLDAVRAALLRGRSPAFLLSLAVSTAATGTLQSGFVLGLAATVTLLLCNVPSALLRSYFPGGVLSRLIAATGLVTAIYLLLQAFFPARADALGVYVPLLAVSGLLFPRAETHAAPLPAALEALVTGLIFTLFLCVLAAPRELLGFGTLWGVPVLGPGFSPVLFARTAPCGFLLLSFLLAAAQWLAARKGGADA